MPLACSSRALSGLADAKVPVSAHEADHHTLLGLLVMLVVAGAIGGAVLWTSQDERRRPRAKDKTESCSTRQGAGEGESSSPGTARSPSG